MGKGHNSNSCKGTEEEGGRAGRRWITVEEAYNRYQKRFESQTEKARNKKRRHISVVREKGAEKPVAHRQGKG